MTRDTRRRLEALATVEAAARWHRVEERVIRELVRSGRLRTTEIRGKIHVDLGRVGELLQRASERE